jgi:hypothetical protein
MRYEVKDKETGSKASNINLFQKKKKNDIVVNLYVTNPTFGGKLILFLVLIFASNFDEDARRR